MPWSKRLLLVCVVLGALSLVVSADKEGEAVQANAAGTSTAAAKVDETTAPMLQQLFRESAGLLRMRAKLSQDYMHDPAITRLYKDARRENSIALQRARLLSAHAVAQPMKNMMGYMHAYMPVMPDEVLMHNRHKDKAEEEDEEEEEDDSKDKKKHKKKDKKEKEKEKEEEEEKEKEEEKKKQEEEEADQKEEEEAEHKKMQKADKKTLPDMEDLLAELMLRREKHPVGTKERDELNMEIDELLSHIDRAKGGDGHDRHELEKEDDHVKALEQEHANDLVMYKEAQAGLPIDEPNAYVNHHLDKLLNHIQTLRRSADGLGGLTLQELSELEVEARALLLDLEEYRGEKVDTRLLKIELDPKLGHVRRKQLLLAEARTRQMRQQQQIERERQDHEIEEQLRANELKEYVGKIQSDTRAVERLHDQHERLLEERARAATAREREQLDQESMVLERQLDSARYQLAKDESDMDRIAATHDLHQLRRFTDPISTSLDLPLNRVQVVHEIVDDRVPSLAHLGAIGTDSPIAVVSGSRSLGIPVSSLLSSTNGKIEPFVRMPMPGEPVDGGVQAETVVDACGKCHTVFVSCQKRCSVDSCAPNLCDTQRSACAQSSNCSGLNINSNNLVVASTMQRVQSCSSGSC